MLTAFFFLYFNIFIIFVSTIKNSDDDRDCQGELVCFQSDVAGTNIPGCAGGTSGTTDYCSEATRYTGNPPLVYAGDEKFENEGYLYKECEGDCDG